MQLSGSDFHAPQALLQQTQNQTNPSQFPKELTPEEKKEVQDLKKRDAEVRRHEQAHKAAAGQHAVSGPNYEYTRGPDGKQYAVGGSVQLDTSEASTPEATIRKAQTIKRAALAPAEPSSADKSIASEASRMEAKARQELMAQKQEESQLYNRDGEKSKNGSSVLDVIV